jgi:hypothetical protein
MGMHAYRIVITGETSRFDELLIEALRKAFEPFGLKLDDEVKLDIGPYRASTAPGEARLVLFFGSVEAKAKGRLTLSPTELVIPVVSDLNSCSAELPPEISEFNALAYTGESQQQAESLSSSVLETLGIIPSRRRIFLSYRRVEAKEAALQLHDALRARQFAVFLDTHEIGFGDKFQDVLWHNLSDSDVLLMLDTKGYFMSRWTEEEFGRAGSMRLGILRVAFPGVSQVPVTTLTQTIDLDATDLKSDGRLEDAAVDRIGDTLEAFRAKSVAARLDNMLGTLRLAVEKHGGSISNPGVYKRVEVSFANREGTGGTHIAVYPAVGVPTSEAVERISKHAAGECALLYDGQSLLQSWIDHLDWFEGGIDRFRWIRADNPYPVLKDLNP